MACLRAVTRTTKPRRTVRVVLSRTRCRSVCLTAVRVVICAIRINIAVYVVVIDVVPVDVVCVHVVHIYVITVDVIDIDVIVINVTTNVVVAVNVVVVNVAMNDRGVIVNHTETVINIKAVINMHDRNRP